MKISYTWLKDFVETDWTAEQTEQLLTNLGLEVEGIEAYESVKGGLQGVVTGKVLSCVKHPNADRLKITSVDIGELKPLQIVCGAPNVAAGQMVPVALVGTTLYDKEKGPWVIKKGKIRGEDSFGMICAEDELGLGDSHEGIMVLDPAVEVGKALAEVITVFSDQVFDIDLTPNRSDAMSHYGVARDLRAGLREQGFNTSLKEPLVSKFRVDNHTRNVPIEIMDIERAPRYCGVTLTNVEVKESPQWLKHRLQAIGLSPINNIVDATNYVLHDLGQPFHAFDADRIAGQKIIVKTVEEGTKFITLDGVERTLSAQDLMICDEKKPLCIAGVFGGMSSGITENTKAVFLESAYFDPVSIRKTAKRHGLNTDASFRFERGIDPNLTDLALKRLVLLIQEIAGGEVSSELNDIYPKKIEDFEVFLRFEKLDKLVGQKFDQAKLKSILSSLGIRVKNITESGLGLTIPPFRADVNREVDVIEEVLRIYGYNNVETNEKLNATIVQNNKYGDHNIQKVVANQLMGQGFYEIMSNSLTDENHLRLQQDKGTTNVYLLNPLSKDLEVMRQSLLSGGLQSMAFNINRKNKNLRFFEFGKSYHKKEGTYSEQKHLALFVTGDQQEEGWNSHQKASDFFYLKGILNALFKRLGLVQTFSACKKDLFSDGLQVLIGSQPVGCFGALKTSVAKTYDIDQQQVLYADLDWDKILAILSEQPSLKVHSIPKFPQIRRDFALLLDQDVRFSAIEALAFKTESVILRKVHLFDVYQGDNLPKGKKSYAVSFTFLDERKTLTDKKVDKIMAKLRKRFAEDLGAELR